MMKTALITCSSLLLASCAPNINTGRPLPPPERFICDALPERPDLPALQPFVTDKGVRVYSKAEVDARDANIAQYIIDVRGAWFSCSQGLKWLDRYYND